jgi:predicted secreted protein
VPGWQFPLDGGLEPLAESGRPGFRSWTFKAARPGKYQFPIRRTFIHPDTTGGTTSGMFSIWVEVQE